MIHLHWFRPRGVGRKKCRCGLVKHSHFRWNADGLAGETWLDGEPCDAEPNSPICGRW